MDIVEAPGEYAFVLDVPGLSKYDMQVTLEEDYVPMMKSAINDGSGSANGKRKREEEGTAYADAMVARYENGVVAVTVKKKLTSEKKTKSVHVAIASSSHSVKPTFGALSYTLMMADLGGVAQWRHGVRCTEMDSCGRRTLPGVMVASMTERLDKVGALVPALTMPAGRRR
ncbi:18.6 kDa class III heat shock protein [Hordeum vulgare]|nr:18.6 kDa class III heat shock protein [Hordeum vulgare]